MPQLSIIVTAYNIENYIEQCLDSVAAQTITDFEALVVDDGSSDSTPEKIQAYADRDSRFIPVLLGENSPGGVATAANAGLDRARGEWVGFVDGDDWAEPDMFEKLLRAAADTGADLSMCKYSEVDDATGQPKEPADARRWDSVSPGLHRLDPEGTKTFLRFIAVPWRKLYRRSLLEDNEIRFPVGDYFYEDNPFHWFSLVSAGSIAIVPEVLCYHRVARAGQTMATADERLFKIFAHHDTIHAWLESRGLLETYQTTLLSWVISQLEWISRRTPQNLRKTLYETVQPIFAQYTLPLIIQALNEGNKGEYARRLSTAIAKQNYARYELVIGGRPATNNPALVAMHHLRYSGVRKTAELTRNYARNRMRDSTRLSQLRPLSWRSTESNADLMFGLAILQQQLDQIDQRLARIEAAQERPGRDGRD